MREIKFRAFDKLSKKMFDVYSFNYFSVEVITNSQEGIYADTKSILRQDCILMQYTGLKDCDGKEIYESDLIVIPNHYPFYDDNQINYVGVVEWVYSGWQYILECVNKDKRGISSGVNNHLNEEGFEENTSTYYKIIGNIYENKEFGV